MNARTTSFDGTTGSRVRTPVLVLLHNRPEQTLRTLRSVAAARPETLLLAADGPRSGDPADEALCALARRAAEQSIDWDCRVLRNYARTPLGCGLHATSGISWAFEQCEQAIVLHDGCEPCPDFWPFCEELLARYASDERVMHLGGSAHLNHAGSRGHSYHFTQFPDGDGWATWRRAWRHFDLTAKLWPVFRRSGCLESVLAGNPAAHRFFSRRLQTACDHPHNPPTLDFWREQWMFACWANSGLGIAPQRDLLHAADPVQETTRTSRPVGTLPVPLVHPSAVVPNYEADRHYLGEVLLPRLVAHRAGRAAEPAPAPARPPTRADATRWSGAPTWAAPSR